MKKINSNNSFTLIETLITITIISIIAALSMLSYTEFTQQSRDSRRKSDLMTIKGALEMYRIDNNAYPTPCAASCSNMGLKFGSATEALTGPSGKIYMDQMPQNPKGNSYSYITIDNKYILSAQKENGETYLLGPFSEITPTPTP